MSSITDLPKVERNNSPEVNSNQSVTNNGVHPMVVYIMSGFILLLYLVMFNSNGSLQREAGEMAAELNNLKGEVAGFRTDEAVAALEETRRTEDALRADIRALEADALLHKSREN